MRRLLLAVLALALLAACKPTDRKLGSSVYVPQVSGNLPAITLTGDTQGVGAGGSIPTTTSKINGVTVVAPMACATLTGTLGIDPQNATTCASDSNTTIQTTCGAAGVGPLVSYRELARRWGTVAPNICATTALIFLSSHTDNTDPVVWDPRISGNVTVSIQGTTPTTVATVSLASTVAKNRTAGSNALLQTNLGASAALGQMVEDTTHSSRSWEYALVSGTTFSMAQPLVKTAIPGFFGPAEVNTWANSDSVNLLSPVAVNLVEYIPEMGTNVDAITSSVAYLYQLAVFAPQTWAPVYLGNVRVYECRIDRVIYAETLHYQYDGLTLTNVLNRGGMIDVGGQLQVYGGAVTSAALTYQVVTNSEVAGTAAQFINDHIIGSSLAVGGAAVFGSTYFDTGTTNAAQTGLLFVVTGSQLWGAGSWNLQGNARMFLNGSSTFASTFTGSALVTGIQLNGSATGCSHTNAAPDVVNCGITTTPAHLDAAAGASGFGGNAVSTRMGGASLSNVAL